MQQNPDPIIASEYKIIPIALQALIKASLPSLLITIDYYEPLIPSSDRNLYFGLTLLGSLSIITSAYLPQT